MRNVLLIIALALCCVFVQRIGASDGSIVLYLPLDENNGNTANDLSGLRNDAILKGGAKWMPGKFNSGVQLVANNYLEVKDSDSLDITKAITIEFWSKIYALTADHQSGVEKGTAWSAGEYNLLPVYSGTIMFQLFDLPDACNDAANGPNVADGEWHFVVGIWDGKNIIINVDGLEKQNMACAGELNKNSDSLYIGCRAGSSRWMNGMLDEVKIYNRALSVTEIKNDMENPAANLAVSPKSKLASTWGSLKASF
jgi:hypothetical protein